MHINRNAILILICAATLVSSSFPLFASEEYPAIKKEKEEHVIILSTDMLRALRQYDMDFQPRRERDYLPFIIKTYEFSQHQAPFAVIGDFNADRISDIVIQGYDKTNDLLIGIISTGKLYKVIEIGKYQLTNPRTERYEMGDHNEYGLWSFLRNVPPGKIKSPYEESQLDLKTDAFEMEYFEKATILYFFQDGKFIRYTTGD